MTISLNNISVKLSGLSIIDGLDLDVSKGKVTLIVGHNGCGKTTLLKAIFGLVQTFEGKIETTNCALGYLSQINNTFNEMTVRKNLSVGLTGQFRGSGDFSSTCIARLWPELLKKLDSPVKDLSGGMQQLTALSRVLISKADFLLLDEPTSGLATFYHDKALNEIRNLAEIGKGIILVEHKYESCLQYADRLLIMRDGSITYDIDITRDIDVNDIRKAYLGL